MSDADENCPLINVVSYDGTRQSFPMNYGTYVSVAHLRAVDRPINCMSPYATDQTLSSFSTVVIPHYDASDDEEDEEVDVIASSEAENQHLHLADIAPLSGDSAGGKEDSEPASTATTNGLGAGPGSGSGESSTPTNGAGASAPALSAEEKTAKQRELRRKEHRKQLREESRRNQDLLVTHSMEPRHAILFRSQVHVHVDDKFLGKQLKFIAVLSSTNKFEYILANPHLFADER